MVRYEEPPKKYSTTINPEINDPYDVFLTKKHEILQKIEEKKHLILLAKSMSDTPVSDGGISHEKAQRTIELLNNDISKLKKDLIQLESINTYGENITSATDDKLKKPIIDEGLLKPLNDETKAHVSKQLKENGDKLNYYICQYCFKKVSQVYKCTKCCLELCSEHLSNHSCIKVYKIDKEYIKEHVSKSPLKPVTKEGFKGGLNRLIKFWNKIKYKLNKKPYHTRFSTNRFFNNLIWIVILSLTFAILYYNIDVINKIVILFPLGNILLLINGIFWIKYAYQLLIGVAYWYGDQRNWMKYLIILIILSLAWQSFNPNELHKNDLSTKLNFSLDYFNSSKIFYIPPEQKNVFYTSPEQKNESKEAFAYLNQLRKQNNRRPMEWDDKIYELAVARSKDMYERNYFDHTTPEGKCVKDFKSAYGLDRYTIAENLGAKYVGYNERDMSFSKTIDVKGEVDGWMGSRGHRYNLMYPDHVKGAIGCYYGVCAFLGANTDPYGLGSGPCTTGDEGIAYWKSVGKQPGEI